MRDFTLHTYTELLTALQQAGYRYITFRDYCSHEKTTTDKYVILRHDVDLKPNNSLQTSVIEHSMGIAGSYYFRAVPQSWDESIIKQIEQLGHEVGYHYENLTTCNGKVDEAYNDFVVNLQRLRKLVPVQTICMHGSPMSPYDSKDIWKSYSYKELGIIGEPYMDTDFADVFYLTDTGRRWDGNKVSVRDKIEGQSERWQKTGLTFHSTEDIIQASKNNKLPNHIMITVHPQRWNDGVWAWTIEWIKQSIKNVIKQALLYIRRNK